MGFNLFLPPQLKINVNEIQEPVQIQQTYINPPEKDDVDNKNAEFDHARSYVKKIKQRFQTQPHIYKAFLEVLHTFSRDHQSLSSVYERVAQLFEGHDDLLEEFTQFLPDTAAPEMSEPVYSPIKTRQSVAKTEEKSKMQVFPSQKEKPSIRGSYGTYEELNYFFKIKQTLPKTDYEEFLKILELFNAEALTPVDLYYLVKDILRDTDPVLIEWFKKFIQVDDLVDDDEPGGYLADFDWSKSERLGPSYRSTPEKWRKWKCSGRIGNPICKEVLNDSWISVPTGSEDGTFKNSRKNQHEELLFKCEDDRYEMDLLIETNLSTIRRLEELYFHLKELPYEERSSFKLKKSDFSVLHINAIKLVYDYRSDEILRMLFDKPETIPIIVQRLKQKDIEWNENKKEWSVYWNNMFKQNYHKTLDYQSTNFKQDEKKNLSHKTLISEIKEKYEKKLKEDSKKDQDTLFKDPLLTYEIKSKNFFEDIKVLLELALENIFPKFNKFKFTKFYNKFLCTFFKIEQPDKKLDDVSDTDEEDIPANKPLWTHTDSPNDTNVSIFLGNSAYYIMFRYITSIYNRLNEAWKFAGAEKRKHYTPEPVRNADMIMNPDSEKNSKELSKEEYQNKRYRQFLYNVELLLSNAIEQSVFESKCRNKFGSHSYVLFTFDRLLILLAKQIHTILTDEVTEKLLNLYYYEQFKIKNLSEVIYLNNCREILDRENNIYIFKYNSTSNELHLGYMDISHIYVSIEQNDDYSRYIHVLVNKINEKDINSNPPIYLKRNLIKNQSIDINNVDISHELGCKIMPHMFKIRYIENTEDYFYRRKTNKRTSNNVK